MLGHFFTNPQMSDTYLLHMSDSVKKLITGAVEIDFFHRGKHLFDCQHTLHIIQTMSQPDLPGHVRLVPDGPTTASDHISIGSWIV